MSRTALIRCDPRELSRQRVFRAAAYLGIYGPFPAVRVVSNEYGEPCYPGRVERYAEAWRLR